MSKGYHLFRNGEVVFKGKMLNCVKYIHRNYDFSFHYATTEAGFAAKLVEFKADEHTQLMVDCIREVIYGFDPLYRTATTEGINTSAYMSGIGNGGKMFQKVGS